MKIKSRNLFTVILSLLCAVLIALGVGFALPNHEIKTVYAAGSEKIIDECAPGANGSGKLSSLFSVLCGGSITDFKSVNDVEKYFESHAKTNAIVGFDTINSEDLGTIYVTFGGIQWQAVCLNKNRKGELVLTLWQRNAEISSPFSKGISVDDIGLINPSCIYGTSYIRAEVLGNGGNYYDYTSGSPVSAVADVSESRYTEFTSGKYSKFIDTPGDIEYQETQSIVNTEPQAYLNCNPNEAYGIPDPDQWWGTGWNFGVTGSNKPGYSDWKDDKVWLPGEVETGSLGGGHMATKGVWGCDETTLKSADCWWRICGHANSFYSNCCVLLQDGKYAVTPTNISSGVRPAVHLNLNALVTPLTT